MPEALIDGDRDTPWRLHRQHLPIIAAPLFALLAVGCIALLVRSYAVRDVFQYEPNDHIGSRLVFSAGGQVYFQSDHVVVANPLLQLPSGLTHYTDRFTHFSYPELAVKGNAWIPYQHGRNPDQEVFVIPHWVFAAFFLLTSAFLVWSYRGRKRRRT
jgi:hypothetical protein